MLFGHAAPARWPTGDARIKRLPAEAGPTLTGAMATRHPDPELLAVIRAHAAFRHQRELEPAEIARERRGRLSSATLVTFTPESVDLARLLLSLYGERLERSERTLWTIWARIPDHERRRAHAGG